MNAQCHPSAFAEARSAYLSGGGDVDAVLAAFRGTIVWVPVDLAGQVFTLMWDSLPWLVVFTSLDRLREFAEASGTNWTAVRAFSTTGADVIDGLMDHAPTPTALMVDASTEPWAFAPVPKVSPHCYVDVEQDRLVIA